MKIQLLILLVFGIVAASMSFSTASGETLVSDESEYLIIFEYRETVAGRLYYPSIMRTDGSVVVEDIASYYPPLEGDVSITSFRYSPSLRWIAVTTYAPRSENANVTQGRIFLIDTLTDTVTQLTSSSADSGLAEWAPLLDRDLLTFAVNRDLEGFLGFVFYDPLAAETNNVQFPSQMGTLALDKVYDYTWLQDGTQLFFHTIRNRMPDAPLSTYLTAHPDGSDINVFFTFSGSRMGNLLPYVALPYWIADGIVTYCNFPSDRLDLCIINMEAITSQPFFSVEQVSTSGQARIGPFIFSPDERLMYFIWSDSSVETAGSEIRVNTLSRWNRQTNYVETVSRSQTIGWGDLAYLSTLPPDILDGTRPRWDERAESTVEAGG